MTLQLQTFTLPMQTDRTRFYSHWVPALLHICDHVLTGPEADYWDLLLEQYGVSPVGPEKRFTLAKKAWHNEGDEVQHIYDMYCLLVYADLVTAFENGWFAGNTDNKVIVTLGIRGIIAVIYENVLKTAFLGGQGKPELLTSISQERALDDAFYSLSREERNEQIIARRKVDPLPRQFTDQKEGNHAPPAKLFARDMRQGRKTVLLHERDLLKKRERENTWTIEEKIYYRIFKKSRTFVKSYTPHPVITGGQVKALPKGELRTEYHILKKHLPSAKKVTLDWWKNALTSTTGS